jgi:acetylglutamate kinase
VKKKIETVKTLLDSLPFIKKFYGETIVIKYGGSAQINPELKESFAIDILMMTMIGIKPVIIHGGGKKITQLLKKLQIETEFKDGVRITSEEAIKVAEMVLSGDINKEIVHMLNHHGAKAIGISGKDGEFLKAKAKDGGRFGFTGEIVEVKSEVVQNLINEKFVPVIAPIATGIGVNHPGFNINADTAACEVAGAIKAKRVLFLTDTPGVLDKGGSLLQSLTKEEVEKLIQNNTISGGMIPKVEAATYAIEKGVEKAHIIDGRVEHSILLELLTSDGIGTEIVKK